MEINQRLEALESRSAYQEHMIDELNSVIIGQQNQLDALQLELQRLRKFCLQEERPREPKDEPPPPHY